MTLELPVWLLADRVTFALAIACGPALEAMLAREPGAMAGTGLIVSLLLLLWQWRRTRRRPCRVEISASGVGLAFEHSGPTVPATGRRAQLLGSTVVLHWHQRQGSVRCRGTLWLTHADLPADALRALRVAMVAGTAGR
jgi:hypothetical protein